MEHSHEMSPEAASRRAAIAGLAVVGFFALVFIGMMLAIYAARFVPKAVNGLASAAVYVSQIFTPSHPASLTAVPQQTLPFGGTATTTATSTPSTATTTPAATTTPSKPVTKPVTAGHQTTTTYPVTVAVPRQPYGLSDLAVTITAVGYLNSDGVTTSFIPSSQVPSGKQGAVQFSIRNAGTNVTGTWDFSAVLPTNNNYTYYSPTENSLNPGDRVDFTLGFDQARSGSFQSVTVTVDPNNHIIESNESNNSVSQGIQIN